MADKFAQFAHYSPITHGRTSQRTTTVLFSKFSFIVFSVISSTFSSKEQFVIWHQDYRSTSLQFCLVLLLPLPMTVICICFMPSALSIKVTFNSDLKVVPWNSHKGQPIYLYLTSSGEHEFALIIPLLSVIKAYDAITLQSWTVMSLVGWR